MIRALGQPVLHSETLDQTKTITKKKKKKPHHARVSMVQEYFLNNQTFLHMKLK